MGSIESANKVGWGSQIVWEIFWYRWTSDWVQILNRHRIIASRGILDYENSAEPLGLVFGNLSQKCRSRSQNNWAWPRTQGLSLPFPNTVCSNDSDYHKAGHNIGRKRTDKSPLYDRRIAPSEGVFTATDISLSQSPFIRLLWHFFLHSLPVMLFPIPVISSRVNI